jgi:hypothetical protein
MRRDVAKYLKIHFTIKVNINKLFYLVPERKRRVNDIFCWSTDFSLQNIRSKSRLKSVPQRCVISFSFSHYLTEH